MSASSENVDAEIQAALSGSSQPAANDESSDDPEIAEALKQDKGNNSPPLPNSPYGGIGPGILSAATAGPAALVGGLVYAGGKLEQLVGSKESDEELDKDVEDAKRALTYRPRMESGEKVANTIGEGASYLGPRYTKPVGDAVFDATGSPLLASAASTAVNVPQFLLPKLGSLARDRLASAPTLTLQEAVNKSFSNQSMGAAGSAPQINSASPQLQAAIADASRRTGGIVNPDVLTAHIEADSHGVQLTKGQATRDPAQFSNEQNSTNPAIVKRLNAQNGQFVDAIDNIRRDASPTNVANSARENGQVVLDDLKAFDEPRTQAIKAAYDAADAANVAAGKGALKLDPAQAVKQATEALEDREELLPGPGRSILQKMRDAAENNQQIPLKQVETWKTIIADETRKADRAADGSAVKSLSDLRDSVEQMAPGSDAAAGVKEQFDQARALARQRFQDMDADPAYKAAVTDTVKKGQPSPLADTFLDDYALSRGAPKSQVDLLMNKLSDEGKGAIASHTLSAIRKGAVNASGNVLPNGYNTAMAKYADKLPSLVPSETIDSLQSLGRTITRAKVAPPGAFVNYSKSGVIMNAAKGAARAGVEHIPYVGKIAVGKMDELAEKKFATEATKPGAGLDQVQKP